MKKTKHAMFRFYEELNDFLPKEKRKVEFPYDFILNPGIKDVIEAIGVPHTEIDLILVNGKPVGFDYRLSDGDRVSVYPEFESLDISDVQKLRPKPLRQPKFILDVHLGKLARLMRMMGFDTYYKNDLDDGEIVELSRSMKRAILTRDVGLLKRNEVERGYWLRNIDPEKQCVEVIKRFDLTKHVKEFSRCISCNGKLISVDKKDVNEMLPEKVKRYYDIYYKCPDCGKIYWKGTHYEDMIETAERIKGVIE